MTNRQSICLTTEVELIHTLDFNAESGIVIAPETQSIGDDEEMHEEVRLEELIEAYTTTKRETGDFSAIYCVSHDLRRIAQELHDTAVLMEERLETACDLYDVDINRLVEVPDGNV